MPIAVVPRQSRGFQGQHGTDSAGANGVEQSAEAGTFDRARSRTAKVFIDHGDTLKAKRLRTLAKVVLAALSFQARPHLLHGRLPYIDAGLPINVNGLNLLAHLSPLLRGLRRSPLRAASG